MAAARLSLACVLVLLSAVALPSTALLNKFDRSQMYKDLGIITDIAFLPDGMILLADFDGKIYIGDPDSSKNNDYELYMKIDDINTKGERGLVSIELDPDFATNSEWLDGRARGGKGRQRWRAGGG